MKRFGFFLLFFVALVFVEEARAGAIVIICHEHDAFGHQHQTSDSVDSHNPLGGTEVMNGLEGSHGVAGSQGTNGATAVPGTLSNGKPPRPLDIGPLGTSHFNLGEEGEDSDALAEEAFDPDEMGCGGAQAAQGPVTLLPLLVGVFALFLRRRQN